MAGAASGSAGGAAPALSTAADLVSGGLVSIGLVSGGLVSGGLPSEAEWFGGGAVGVGETGPPAVKIRGVGRRGAIRLRIQPPGGRDIPDEKPWTRVLRSMPRKSLRRLFQ
jgi:hypothetical protein